MAQRSNPFSTRAYPGIKSRCDASVRDFRLPGFRLKEEPHRNAFARTWQVERRGKHKGQEGYILISIMLIMTLMLFTLAIEAPRIAQQIKREKEIELEHRGTEYAKAIAKYTRKFGHPPVSLEQLENTNNLRFLRKRYKDPMTGKDDWQLLHQGDVLAAQPGGSTLGQPVSSIGATTNTPQNGTPDPNAAASPSPTPSATATPSPGFGTSIGTTTGTGTGGFGSGFGSNANQGPTGGGFILGVRSTSKEESIRVKNGKNHYNEWDFTAQSLQTANVPAGGSIPGATPIGANPNGGNPTDTPAQPPQQPGPKN
ncbi:MAG TPA: hypothetical protein VKZ53_08635 [Candidatus Angelobacter sp.]|nr:hypothetical protein [Candidatus Angelobacter sp.]